MNLDQFTPPGGEDAADYFCGRDKKYGTSALQVAAVIQLRTVEDSVTPSPRTIGELMEWLDIVTGIS